MCPRFGFGDRRRQPTVRARRAETHAREREQRERDRPGDDQRQQHHAEPPRPSVPVATMLTASLLFVPGWESGTGPRYSLRTQSRDARRADVDGADLSAILVLPGRYVSPEGTSEAVDGPGVAVSVSRAAATASVSSCRPRASSARRAPLRRPRSWRAHSSARVSSPMASAGVTVEASGSMATVAP